MPLCCMPTSACSVSCKGKLHRRAPWQRPLQACGQQACKRAGMLYLLAHGAMTHSQGCQPPRLALGSWCRRSGDQYGQTSVLRGAVWSTCRQRQRPHTVLLLATLRTRLSTPINIASLGLTAASARLQSHRTSSLLLLQHRTPQTAAGPAQALPTAGCNSCRRMTDSCPLPVRHMQRSWMLHCLHHHPRSCHMLSCQARGQVFLQTHCSNSSRAAAG